MDPRPRCGIFRTAKHIGNAVSAGEIIGYVANPYEEGESAVRATHRGIIVGRTTLPIVNMGDALFHLAWSEEISTGKRAKDMPRDSEPVMDEDEII